MKTISFSTELPLAPAEAFERLTDPGLLSRRAAEFGGAGEPVVRELPDGGRRCELPRQLPVDKVSGVAKGFVPAGGRLTHVEELHPPGADGVCAGRWEVLGAPVATVGGQLSLVPSGTGSRLTMTGEIKVSVPLLGGRIEGFVGDYLGKLAEAELSWLSLHLKD